MSVELSAPFKERAEAMLARVFRGIHHVNSLKHESPTCCTCIHLGEISTFDFDELTRLVFGAHDFCLRVEIKQGGPNRLKIRVTDRTREGLVYDRHPTLQEAREKWIGGAR